MAIINPISNFSKRAADYYMALVETLQPSMDNFFTNYLSKSSSWSTFQSKHKTY